MPDDRLFHKCAGHSEKVSGLTHLEFRVWWQYIESADDFGVLRMTAIAIQADNDALAREAARKVDAALKRLVAVGLVRTFIHQSRSYLYQHDWQDWQGIGYPRGTHQPKPPDDALAGCTAATQHLFTFHPGGRGRRKGSDGSPPVRQTDDEPLLDGSPNVQQTDRAYARGGGRQTANGLRLTANGSEGVQREPSAPERSSHPRNALPRALAQSPLAHDRHGWCSDVVCMPDRLYADFLRKSLLPDDAARTVLAAWCERQVDGLTAAPGGDDFKFWRERYDADPPWPVAQTAPKVPARTAATSDAIRRFAGKEVGR